MSRLCRLKSYKTIGEDGEWAYREITNLRNQVEQLTAERDTANEISRRMIRGTDKCADEITTLRAERDAAFALSKCECEINEACKNLVGLHDEVERLKAEWGEPVAWRIKFKSVEYPDFLTVRYHGTNAIADYRQIDPDAVCEPLYARKDKS